MYQTLHSDGITKGIVRYTVWSDVVGCPHCGEEMVYWEVAVGPSAETVYDPFSCPHCGADLTTRSVDRLTETVFDPELNRVVDQARQVPVLINYSVGRKRFKKKPDECDLEIIKDVERRTAGSQFPISAIPKQDRYFKDSLHLRRLTHVHHFYKARTRRVLATLWQEIDSADCSERTRSFLRLWFTSLLPRLDKLNRYMPKHNRHVGPLVGTLYISWLSVEISALDYMRRKLRHFQKLDSPQNQNAVATSSCTDLSTIPKGSVDYIFVDPPFGHNLMYSELNYRWEAWLRVFSSSSSEAIVSDAQDKQLDDYRNLMRESFE
jgi:16S rRNA G966 N2-methylase RsmD